MHLKSVTLKGFKSFAQPTTFVLEPGVTCIVGPNGSGKSNVVDALAWVMGEQGAKTLRGGKMEDVIFAGTATRGPLGRAEVTLTIDNHDGVLPIEYSEVTISRTLFRNGASEYAINGQSCRLLDVQELLSDTGLGREMHVIVGQGRLDAVLQASADDRRGFIEEAAGILKHRRRKEKTLRKLEAMEANLTRLSDLAGELRRQLKPLGRQAEIAREAATIAADVRDAKARLYADDLVTLRTQLADHARSEHERQAERAVLQDEAAGLRQRIAELEADQQSEAVDRARATLFALEQVQDRLRNLHALAGQRLTLLADDDDPATFEPTVSTADIDTAREEVAALADGLGEAQDAAAKAARDVIRARAELDALDADIAEQSALVSAHDMRLTALRGTADAARSRLDAVRVAHERQERALDAALARRADAEAERAAVEADDAVADAAGDLSVAYEDAERESTEAESALAELRDRLHAAEREVESVRAQTAALGRALDVRNAAAALVAEGGTGIRGLVSDEVRAARGHETAIAAALGALAEGVLVDDDRAATDVAERVRRDDLGAVDAVIANAAAPASPTPLAEEATPAAELVTAPPGVLAALSRVYVVDDLATAMALRDRAAAIDAVLVTRIGEVLTTATLRAGSGGGRSRLELAAERDVAQSRLDDLAADLERLRPAFAEATQRMDDARRRAAAALAALRAHDAALAADAERRNRAVVRHEAAVAECERLTAAIAQARQAVDDAEAIERTAEAELATAEAAPRPILDASARDELLAALDSTREAEMRTRLDVEALRERVRSGQAAVEQLRRQREREVAAAAEAARRAVIRRAQREVAANVSQRLPAVLDSTARSVAQARTELHEAEQARSAVSAELTGIRTREREVRERLTALTETVHGLELQMHEKRLHVTSLLERVRSELAIDEDILIAEYGPDQPVPGDDDEESGAFDRDGQRRRLQAAERKLGQLGRVNPLALEEFAALEQRHAFLTEQLADLQKTREDLMTIIGELDEHMQTIFLAAFEDTRTAFGEVFPLLFPGGTGSIALTDPDNPLTTGIEVSVRPAGKKIERLSLLSGGERSLAAVAFLTAIFTARPSPFYILDEVEAALDDANLGRLLSVFERLRASSQLIVITHQKRTMEIADALYGVSMRQDGVSAVVGQRVRERAAV